MSQTCLLLKTFSWLSHGKSYSCHLRDRACFLYLLERPALYQALQSCCSLTLQAVP